PPYPATNPSSSDSAAEGGEGDFLEEDRAEDLLGDGRGGRAAVAAALDEHDYHDLGILHRGEGREPRVILALLGLRIAHRLRGAGLARHVEAGNARGHAGAVVVDDGPQRLPQEREDHR